MMLVPGLIHVLRLTRLKFSNGSELCHGTKRAELVEQQLMCSW